MRRSCSPGIFGLLRAAQPRYRRSSRISGSPSAPLSRRQTSPHCPTTASNSDLLHPDEGLDPASQIRATLATTTGHSSNPIVCAWRVKEFLAEHRPSPHSNAARHISLAYMTSALTPGNSLDMWPSQMFGSISRAGKCIKPTVMFPAQRPPTPNTLVFWDRSSLPVAPTPAASGSSSPDR